MSRRILVIDDEQGIRAALGQLLEYEGYDVHTVSSAPDGVAEFQKWRPHLVFLDVKMAGMDGMEALKRIRELDPSALVVMISGHATIRTAVEATQAGAYEILEKPLDTDRILVMLRNAFTNLDLKEENTRLRESVDAPFEIVGKSPVMRALMEKVEKVAATPARVLITGENGTGKELVARALHRQSPRANKPFVEVNCAAIPGELIESELFGHMKGSFTGAVADRAGKFEQANKGTLFLDEIGDMSLAAQAKVLRVLQDNVITRIGGSKPISVDVRVIAATNKTLESEIAAGKFREDLYYRLNVVPLSAREGIPPRTFTQDALDRLAGLDWPGNVRELRNTVERLLILAPETQIASRDIDRLAGQRALDDAGMASLAQCKTFEEFKDAAERAFLLNKLREFDWNVSETARAVEMPRSNLYKKIERYSLAREHS
ncbi:MAG: Fis family transcriptional regulator [Gemmatimonas sp. 13_1_20CM_3_60_15]|nr:MAG: Fis family transcriptional regulator [Gemmatimonas sp. 13_1_20CM_3_60_15]